MKIKFQLVRVEEAPHVLDHLQRMGVHRVDMEQVVLHLSHDTAELGQVASEDAVAVHAPQGVGQPCGVVEKRQKLLLV